MFSYAGRESGRLNRFPTYFRERRGATMKFATTLKTLGLGLVLLLASAAFAAGKGNLQLSHPVTANGVQLQAGDYTVAWEGTGPDVEVSFMQGKKVVAKAPARIVDMDKPANRSAALVDTKDDGTSSLQGIRFEGKKYTLELGAASNGMQAGSSK
jgi:hypothetical protein